MFEKINTLKKELDSFRPINKEDELRIMQKFRLDWNYHSNNLEGNTLTYGETKALILFNLTAQGKPLKDHLEVAGHDEAVKWVIEVVKGQRPLTESFIRQIHELLLKEPYEVDAITPDGQPTKKIIKVGKYKTTTNHVKTRTGEIFRFATPEETPALMNDLIYWYREKIEENNVNAIIVATQFHYKFIRIHPFDDGNGRTARILMNFILMRYGYSPVVIKTEDKQNYFAALRQADAGIMKPFIDYIASNLISSMELMIKGLKGEEIEEPDDIIKEIALLEKRLESISEEVNLVKSNETVREIYTSSVKDLFLEYVNRCKLFDKFYVNSQIILEHNRRERTSPKAERLLEVHFPEVGNITNEVKMRYKHETFNRSGFNEFNNYSEIIVRFKELRYIILIDGNKEVMKKTYNQKLTKNEIKYVINKELKSHKNKIETELNNIEKNK